MSKSIFMKYHFRYHPIALIVGILMSQELLAASARMDEVVKKLGIEAPMPQSETDAQRQAVERLVEEVLKTHPKRAQALALLAARESDRDAATARWQPSFVLSGSQNREWTEEDSPERSINGDNQLIGLELRQNLWRGGQDQAFQTIAEQNRKLAELNGKEQTEALALAVRRAALEYNYFAMRQLIDEAAAADARELRGLAEKKFAAGQVGRVDVYTTQLRETSAEATVQRGAIARRKAWRSLEALRPLEQKGDAWTLAEPLLSAGVWPVPSTPPQLAPTLVQTLNEQAAQAQMLRADAQLDQKFGERYLPRIDLVASLNQSRTSNEIEATGTTRESLRREATTSTLRLQFNWQLWDQVGTHEVRAVRSEKTAAEAAIQLSRLEAESQAGTLRAEIQELYQTLDLSRQAFLQADQLYNAQKKLYEAGLISLLPLIDADNEKLKTLSDWLEQLQRLNLNLLRWESLERGFLQK